MKIIITTDKESDKLEDFIFNYLPNYVLSLFKRKVDKRRIKQLDKAYNIDCVKTITYALSHMYKSKTGNYMYIIGVNKNLKYKGNFIIDHIKKITYGDMNHKGYPILLNIFKYVAERVNLIYEEWLEKWQ